MKAGINTNYWDPFYKNKKRYKTEVKKILQKFLWKKTY